MMHVPAMVYRCVGCMGRVYPHCLQHDEEKRRGIQTASLIIIMKFVLKMMDLNLK